MDLISVMAEADDRRVVLWERHPAHPGGEAWIAANGQVVVVARTPAVAALLAAGTVIPYITWVAPEPAANRATSHDLEPEAPVIVITPVLPEAPAPDATIIYKGEEPARPVRPARKRGR